SKGETMAAVDPLGEPDRQQAPGTEQPVRDESTAAQGLPTQREPGTAVVLPLRRGDAPLFAEMDRSTPVAAVAAVRKAGQDATRTPRWHSQLLPNQGATGGRRSRQRQHQSPFTPRPRLYESPLLAAQSPTHGRDQNPIRCLSKS